MTNQRTVTVERSTSTAHRLRHYDGACGNVHGHNIRWELTLTVNMETTGDDNMPLDFKRVSDLIDETDHAILLNENDPLTASDHLGAVIEFDGDPTTEHVAQWMADQLVSLAVVTAAEVTMYETDKYGMTATASTTPDLS